MGQNLCKSLTLISVQICKTDSCMVAQNSQNNLDTLCLKSGNVCFSASIFEQISHFVIEIKDRITESLTILINTVLPTNICGEEFHNVSIRCSIGKNIITCIEWVNIVRLHIDGNLGSFVSVCTSYDCVRLFRFHSGFFRLLT